MFSINFRVMWLSEQMHFVGSVGRVSLHLSHCLSCATSSLSITTVVLCFNSCVHTPLGKVILVWRLIEMTQG